jgi:hypothetical protein
MRQPKRRWYFILLNYFTTCLQLSYKLKFINNYGSQIEAFNLKQSEMAKTPNTNSIEAGEKALMQVMGPQSRGRVRGLGLGGSSQEVVLLRRSSHTTNENKEVAKVHADMKSLKGKCKKRKKEVKALKDRLKKLEKRVSENGDSNLVG